MIISFCKLLISSFVKLLLSESFVVDRGRATLGLDRELATAQPFKARPAAAGLPAGHKKDGIITSLFSFDEVATIYSFSFDFYYFSFNATL